jgi:hypothetical protein
MLNQTLWLSREMKNLLFFHWQCTPCLTNSFCCWFVDTFVLIPPYNVTKCLVPSNIATSWPKNQRVIILTNKCIKDCWLHKAKKHEVSSYTNKAWDTRSWPETTRYECPVTKIFDIDPWNSKVVRHFLEPCWSLSPTLQYSWLLGRFQLFQYLMKGSKPATLRKQSHSKLWLL